MYKNKVYKVDVGGCVVVLELCGSHRGYEGLYINIEGGFEAWKWYRDKFSRFVKAVEVSEIEIEGVKVKIDKRNSDILISFIEYGRIDGLYQDAVRVNISCLWDYELLQYTKGVYYRFPVPLPDFWAELLIKVFQEVLKQAVNFYVNQNLLCGYKEV